MRLLGKKVLVTGAAAGIGCAIATRFAEEGARLACVDVDARRLDSTVRMLSARGAEACAFTADAGAAADVERVVHDALAKLQGLDILVNNVGINSSGTVESLTLSEWNRVIAVILTSIFLFSKALWGEFSRQGSGVILNMSSIMGLTGAADSIAYCATKAAIVGLTKSLAADGAPLGIRANCLCPGYVKTPVMDRIHSKVRQDHISAQIPLKRMASPAEIATAALYLASDDASYVTGASLTVDGAATTGFAGCY